MTIRRGNNGKLVFELQTLLNRNGHSVAVDGFFGGKNSDETGDALERFQHDRGLKADRLAGPLTMAELRLTAKPETAVNKWPFIDTASPFPAMSAARRLKVFGEYKFERADGDNIRILGGWESDNIESFFIPQLAGVPFYSPNGLQKCSGYVRLHKMAGPVFQRFFALVDSKGLMSLVRSFDGAFVPRFVRGSRSSLSNHAWGTAIDINCFANGLGREPARIGTDGYLLPLVALAHQCGLYWGGNFSRKDGMHWEIAVL